MALVDEDRILKQQSDGENRKSNLFSTLILSADAPEFVPGRKWTPPNSPTTTPSFPANNSSFELRTSNEVNKINSNLKLSIDGEETIDQSESSTNFEHSTKKIDFRELLIKGNEDDKKSDDEWTMASGSNRRRPPKAKNFNLRNDNFLQSTRNMPGENVVIDNSCRFVVWSTDLEIARRSIDRGRLVFIFMRGVPGSGKTHLAKSLQGNGIKLSADDYFLQEDNTYRFDRMKLEDAHAWCLQRALQALTTRVTPIIIDNTNVCLWEMAKYVKPAVRNNYDIYFIEPNTPWKYDANECARRNQHNVPKESIETRIRSFEPVNDLRPFMESGILRAPFPKPVYSSSDAAIQKVASTGALSRVSSSSEVEQKRRDASRTQSPEDAWESSDSSSMWTIEEQKQQQFDYTPLRDSDSQTTAEPKEQRTAARRTPESIRLVEPITIDSEKSNEAKKLENAATRRKRLGGFGGISLGNLAPGAWQLPNDLAGGLSSIASSENESSIYSSSVVDSKGAPNSTNGYREIRVRDDCTQVTDKHLALATLNHRRLSRQSVDGCEFDLEERSITKSETGDRLIIKCDRSVQCELDGHSTTSPEDDGFDKAMATLRSCFPQVDHEDIEEIYERCDRQLEWAVNVLLDSGYDVDWTSAERNSDESEQKTDETDPLLENEESPPELEPPPGLFVTNEFKSADVVAEPSIEKSSSFASRKEEFFVDDRSSEGESLYTMELSVDMAGQLQRMFAPIFPDIPPDLLSPPQLKFRIPNYLAVELYRCWLAAQAKDGGSEGDSDFFSDESLSDDLAFENSFGQSGVSDGGRSIKKNGGAYRREDDSLTTERQIWMDEQFARQLASEDDGVQDSEPDVDHSIGSPADSLATKIKLKRLYELFPSVDREMLRSVFVSNKYHLDRTIDMFCDTYNLPKGRASSPGRGYATRAAQKPVTIREQSGDNSGLDELTYEQLRQEAVVHYEERQANFQKAQEYYRKGMTTVAYYYAQRGHLHNSRFKEANERAAKKILQQRRAANPSNDLDLHGLHVAEAIRALVDTLREYENRPGKEIKIVTGKGLHSSNGPKIKPAVVNFLRQRGYNFTELTSGMLIVTIK